MLKIEYIWREILFQAIERKNRQFTITKLADKFHLSTSVVSHALFPLRQMGAVEIGKVNSRLIDLEKLLIFWATRRELKKDIIYQTYSVAPVMEREALMPHNVFPTAYTYCRLFLGDVPSDYDNIYFYTREDGEIMKRFPPDKKHFPNIFILKQDEHLASYDKVPLGQVFADLWNLSEWYGREFANYLIAKIKKELFI